MESHPQDKAGFTLRVLYLFAGADRKTSVASYLRVLAEKNGWQLVIEEIDIRRDPKQDLSVTGFQDNIITRISSGEFHAIICTPPCSTWTRVRMANMRGPPPLRSGEYPWGFPWVSNRHRHQLELGNELVRFAIRVWEAAATKCRAQDGVEIFVFGEHPEDLGMVVREEDRLFLRPASIWQLSELRKLIFPSSKLNTVAINQCCWGAPWRKPTRLISTSQVVLSWGSNSWPVFDSEGFYQGPLEKDACQCSHLKSLARRSNEEAFRTAGSDIYPPALDEAIAKAVIEHCQPPKSGPLPTEGGKTETKDPTLEGREERKSMGKRPVEDKCQHPPGRAKKTGGIEKSGWGNPIKCYYKGSHRTIHDGGGLCSPGRWPIEHRHEMTEGKGRELSSVCKSLFLKWILETERSVKGGVKEVFWSLAGGKTRGSPFEEWMVKAREELDGKLSAMGLDCNRQEGDRESEVNFRRLKAMLEASNDEDAAWLEELSTKGVKLGVDEDMPRVEAVFEEKEKWNLDFTEEIFKDAFADNYESAKSNEEDIKRQVMEEVDRGTIIHMSMEEAKTKFEGRIAVAALGAVPKELGSSVVRIVHDGSYSVDVNHRIKVLDRMRFPTIDDAGGIINHLEDEMEACGGGARLSVLYDVSRAHKLIPVREEDWGFQAFRLPGEGHKDRVFVHTRGTFGIASAAYWWQRLAANVVRLCHRLGGRSLGLLHLLFADDGWLTSYGEFFWRRILFWFFCLDLVEVPISWKKVRGGVEVSWIGYQLDVRTFRKGISSKKVKWMKDWLSKHLSAGGILGRDLKSALGRFSFVAGALPHVRPFLGPLFAWSAVLAGGTFAKFPDAVRILLEYVVGETEVMSMSKPRRIKPGAVEAFRVDAKAEGECIVIGGWEVHGGISVDEARWFSITLNRKNAPWAYVKGEPFRSIATLELCAVLVAVMLFGADLVELESKNVLTLSASTDNLGNTYVLKHFMSCKYPLSIVVMELASQLHELGLELDLNWIPRGQNTEADALTNGEFQGFDPTRRIEVEFGDLNFMILEKLMGLAGDLDSEVKMAKTSKEAKGDRPIDTIPRKKRGSTRWEDPW